jgi:hypothetical protein
LGGVKAFPRQDLLTDVTSRQDWQNMMATFQTSGFQSLRAFVNYTYLTGAVFKIPVASAIGAMTGLVGGLLAAVGRRAATIAS